MIIKGKLNTNNNYQIEKRNGNDFYEDFFFG